MKSLGSPALTTIIRRRGLGEGGGSRCGRSIGSSCNNSVVVGIDTSCDDTAVGVVEAKGVRGRVLSSVVRSQWETHAPHGGVVPVDARQMHEQQLEDAAVEAFREAFPDATGEDAAALASGRVAAVAVTTGPGLLPCLRVGATYAAQLAASLRVPLVQVNHLEGHLLSVRLRDEAQEQSEGAERYSVEFPFLCLLVSGGHSQVLMCEKAGSYRLLGGTMDDSLGEAYDKVARLLGLPFFDFERQARGAALLEALAAEGDPLAFAVPKPLSRRPRASDFSFSGLKSCIARIASGEDAARRGHSTADVAAVFQETALEHLIDGTRHALVNAPPVSALVIAGGVACNQRLREKASRLALQHGIRCVFPPPSLCADNGAMIAWAAIERIHAGILRLSELPFSDAPQEPAVFARWSLDPSISATAQFRSGFPHRSRELTTKPWKFHS
ncbi:MAG: tRNA (adenosine(37)-N6)-threonylcarbamoyltransferase complex transferase subunit TsaD [archaeon]|nr:tRNA (adenosine(37)-N6)-threonylcarbamoyltransferase complex transferase subunit TsaD [archaeon]